MARAPRRLMRMWVGLARGAVLAFALVATSQVSAQEITSAHYDGPTMRYPHAVLGDDVEYDTLVVRLSDGREMSARWDEDVVFEDLAPRLADVNGDGSFEVITIESHASRGARLAVWGLRDGQLALLAATPHIGTRFRWLAPVAWEDLDGDGLVELAYVDRPHLAKTLRVWRVSRDFDLTEVATLPDVTNHRIGWDYIAGGARNCGQGPEMVLADAVWTQVVSVTFDGKNLQTRDLGPYTPTALEAALDC